eukprot:3125569-Rhodomonas_salina.1
MARGVMVLFCGGGQAVRARASETQRAPARALPCPLLTSRVALPAATDSTPVYRALRQLAKRCRALT